MPSSSSRGRLTWRLLESRGTAYQYSSRRGLEQENVRFLISHGPVLDAARDDDELPFLDGHAPIPKLHREPAFVDEKEFVLVLVLVPDERTLELDQREPRDGLAMRGGHVRGVGLPFWQRSKSYLCTVGSC